MLYSLLFAIGLGVCHAIPTSTSDSVVHEIRGDAPGWKKLGRVNKESILPLRIGLSQKNLDKGPELLANISDPNSAHYAKHLTQAQVIDLFQPASDTVSAVKGWLAQHVDITRVVHSDNKAWLAVDASTEEAEKLLHTEIYAFQHLSSGRVSPASDSYQIPKSLVGHIDYITPGVRLLNAEKRRTANSKVDPDLDQTAPSWNTPSSIGTAAKGSNASDLSHCDKVITDSCIRALYQVPIPRTVECGTPQANNALGIFESGDIYVQENLDKYFAKYTPWIPKGTHPTNQLIDGAKAHGPSVTDTGESDLDLIMAYPLVYPQEIKLYQTDDSYYSTHLAYDQGLFNTFLDAIDGSYCTYKAFGEKGDDPKLDPVYPDRAKHGYKGQLQCGVYEPTPVISISYGVEEAVLPPNYQKRQCNEFMKLALQGVSVLVSSGDVGVAGRTGCLGKNFKVFNPSYPVNCPWVTAVGATKIPAGRTVFEAEVAANDAVEYYSSGGGFSNIYSIPTYQAAAVSTYLTQHPPPYKSYEGGNFHDQPGQFNRAGRGIPDVAANGDKDVIYNLGQRTMARGTSASTPVFAAIVNRINEERLAVGKATLGFLNTALYQNPWVLNDITEGHNPGCETKGFSASAGWDPVTGLGTPNYDRMLAYFMSLP